MARVGTGPGEIVAPGDTAPDGAILNQLVQGDCQRQVEVFGENIVHYQMIEIGKQRLQALLDFGAELLEICRDLTDNPVTS